jgi:uncharacterized protein (DUF1501 family)
MERRDFLKLASMAGLGVVAGGLFPGGAHADEPYTGKLWINIHAGGGWDPTSLCDPKPGLNNYTATEVVTLPNGISYPNISTITNDPADAIAFNNLFFEKWGAQLLVVNGIDCSTNSHDVGTRATWSGSLIENRPSFAALVAGAYGATKPMAFITNGGYDVTANVVSQTRVGNIDALKRLAYPTIINPNNPDDQQTFHADGTIQRIADARQARHDAMLAKQQLPRIRKSMSNLYTARVGQNELKRLTEFLPAPDEFEQSDIRRQAQVAIAAYQAGLCISANLSTGGFDTHNNHDPQQRNALANILDGVDYLMQLAVDKGVGDKIVISVGSDFGRTPDYNDQQGKDHWSITSMMFLSQAIARKGVVGASDDRHNPLEVDPASLQVGGGVRIAPGHIQKALRKLAEIDTNPIVTGFGVKEEEEMPIFG